MRLVTAFLFLASPATAWEFDPDPICTLRHSEPDAAVTVTYDPGIKEYAITVTKTTVWQAAPTFAIRFDGNAPITISTDRQMLDGKALTVTDSGFDNVLNGLAGNRTATALLGQQTASVSLVGAADPVEAFRRCTSAIPAV